MGQDHEIVLHTDELDVSRHQLTLLLFLLSVSHATVVLYSQQSTKSPVLGGWDASILATMSLEGIHILMTHDQAFKRVPDIEIVDPI